MARKSPVLGSLPGNVEALLGNGPGRGGGIRGWQHPIPDNVPGRPLEPVILQHWRVIEVGGGIAACYAGKLLADAGADVIKIEPPGGEPLRRWSASGADLGNRDGPLFQFLNTSKRSVIADWGDPGIIGLLSTADIVIDSTDRGLPPSITGTARRANPALVVVSLSPWGRTGPCAGRPATEFTLQAECGGLGKRGNPERPPVQSGGAIGEWTTGIYAGVGALAAARAAGRSGRGDHVDVSMFETMVMTMCTYAWINSAFTGDPDPERPGRNVELPSIEPTADGHVGFCTVARQQFLDFLVMIERPDWQEDEEMCSHAGRWKRREEFRAAMHAWTTRRTTAEVIAEASARRIPVAPIGNGATVPTLEAFLGREAFTANPSGGFTQPTVPYELHGTTPRPFAPVPAPGEHTGQIEARAPQPGRDELASLPLHGVRPGSDGIEVPGRDELASLPLHGVRVIDFTAWWAGPIASHSLALLGADVVKIESVSRPDGMRFASARPPTEDQWWEWGMVFHGANTNKRGITLDMRSPRGVAMAERLISDADVVIENFTPRVMEEFGLDWDRLSSINPRVIMARMPAFGLSGAWRNNTGFAQTMEQLTGMANITGYPDEDPQIPRGPCDPLAGMHAVFAVLAALEERDRTGRGRLVEVTMVSAALNAAAEQLVEYSALGRQLPRQGNRGPRAAPQGVYPAAGTERWVAVAVADDAQWEALCHLCERSDWARYNTVSKRRAAADEIDTGLAEWLAGKVDTDAVRALTAVGVPAGVVMLPAEIGDHPQLRARSFIEPVHHPVCGEVPAAGLPFRFDSVPGGWIRSPAPTLGQHNCEILTKELGISPSELADLESQGVIGTRPVGV
ncbi:CoA transferase [Candidatus Poriferisocius sp.]|uniref:CaiB/BaiF CoA-transferase family protein n=1 Tax=Candidatus Poriferisocius sp. TaxID=3101276 RepID=UPI003B020DB4